MKTSGFIPSKYDPEVEPLRFLGFLIERIPSGQIVMHQRSYIDFCLKANDMEKLKGLTTLPAVKKKLMKMVRLLTMKNISHGVKSISVSSCG